MNEKKLEQSVSKISDLPDVEILPYLEMLNTDFDNIYKVNLKALDERLLVLKLSLTFFSAPFLVITALLSAKIIYPKELSSFDLVPPYIFIFIFICGLANLIPLLRFIEVTGTHMRTARIINNFRLLYSSNLTAYFRQIGWQPNLPEDPDYPPAFAVFNWSGINILFITLLNSFYLTIGLCGLDERNPISFTGIFIYAICSIGQYSFYFFKGKGKNFIRPKNPQKRDRVEI